MLRCFAIVSAILMPVLTAGSVRSQTVGGSQSQGAMPDSVKAKIDSLLAAQAFMTNAPSFISKTKGDVTKVEFSNAFSNVTRFRGLGVLNFNASMENKDYRLQDRFGRTRLLTTSYGQSLGAATSIGARYSNRRSLDRIVAAIGGVQDVKFNSETVSMSASHAARFGAIGLDANTYGDFSNSEKTYKNDKTFDGSLGGGLSYRVLPGVSLYARGFVDRGRENTITTTGREFDPFRSAADSLSAAVTVAFSDSLNLSIGYSDFDSDREYGDQARTSSQAQTQEVVAERETRSSRELNVAFDSRIISTMTLKVSASHLEQDAAYRVTKTRDSGTISDEVGADVAYTAPFGTRTTFSGSHRISELTFGELSLNARDERAIKLRGTLSHNFTKSLSLQISGANSITQWIYVDKANNNRDRDQVDTRLSATIGSKPFEKISISISGAFSQVDYVNIDKSISGDNRTEKIYDLGPTITYNISPRVNLVQRYGVKIDFTDYWYRATDNFLDRTLTFTNEIGTKITTRLDVDFDYYLTLHDQGSYLPLAGDTSGERYLDVASEDRRDRAVLSANYTFTKGLEGVIRYEYVNRTDHVIGSTRYTYTDNGSINGGLTGSYKWGANNSLRFVAKRVSQYGRISREAQKNYWEFNSELSYSF